MTPATIKPMDAYQSNLSCLYDLHPELAKKVDNQKFSEAFQIESSKSGSPTLLLKNHDGKTLSLHSRYNPAQEAEQFIQKLNPEGSSNFIILGLGLGYHLLNLIQNAPRHSKFLVVESKVEIFHRALQCKHIEPLLQNKNIRWIVGEIPDQEITTLSDWWDSFTLNGFKLVRFPPLSQLDPEFYENMRSSIEETLRETQVAHNTRRTLSRLLYQNCLQNFMVSLSAPGINNLRNIFQNDPVLIVAAGPSLDKNIQLIRGSQSFCRIIAVSTALKPLQNAGIEADFAVAIDPKPVSCVAFENINKPLRTRLIFNPCIPENIPNNFQGKKFAVEAQPYIWKFLTRGLTSKGELGNNSSVAHTALNLALHMGCNPIILVGQDLSFSKDRSHCSGAFHGEFHQQNIGTNQTVGKLQKRNRSDSILAASTAQDIFGNSLVTSNALDTFRFPFERIKKSGVRLINATEGGVNISNLENATLKETLAGLPGFSRKSTIAIDTQDSLDFVTEEIKQNISSRVQSQIQNFEHLLLSIQNWEKLNREMELKESVEASSTQSNKKKQVLAAEIILEEIIKDEDSVQLLQEYLYSAFLDWNQETYQIDLLKNENEIVLRKYQRDRIIFLEIEKAIKWLISEFNSLLR
ncbi:MAG: motility associated factor glycosyltransferase family protein [Candidatus Nitronauta litoralis]|uniref:Motility associated factor glycosyltransferase family protein n=1 Tax=Candidatus Nitronauta litoralis TaxID=2705533 RepID=A0A7T0G186_9BACT|nr:MAG: motility associated factor glycosyltransferase family protein [Candidatus Nitronauta litoralis]